VTNRARKKKEKSGGRNIEGDAALDQVQGRLMKWLPQDSPLKGPKKSKMKWICTSKEGGERGRMRRGGVKTAESLWVEHRIDKFVTKVVWVRREERHRVKKVCDTQVKIKKNG